MSETTRRSVLAGAAGVSAAVVLSACSDGDSGPDGTGANDDTGTNGASSAPPAGGGAVKAADIPVGGGKIYADGGYVITQPTAGEFKPFSVT
jgi:hypothetical protein